MKFLLIVLILLTPATMAQTKDELAAKYGAPVGDSFLVRPGIAVTVTYFENGKAKEFRIASDRQDTGTVEIPIVVIRSLFDELVPRDMRGRRLSSNVVATNCPPKNDCKGYEDIWQRVRTLVVSNKRGVLYTLLTLNDKSIPAPGGLELLPGFEHFPGNGIDTLVGKIQKFGGLEIRYDIGFLADNMARRYQRSNNNRWVKEEKINGDSLVVIYTTQNLLIATFENAMANFYAETQKDPEIEEFLTIVRTYKPAVGNKQ